MNGVSATARPVFPYSVVNGGVRSREELEAAIQADPLVREHYSGFNVGEARVLRLSAPIHGYVSFRRDGKIYWTHRQLEIRAGERVLSDGKMLIRARCGNQISIVPMRPTTHFEPKLEVLNVPDPPQLVSPPSRIDPDIYAPSLPSPPKPEVTPPPFIPPPLIAVPNSHTPLMPITPEPSTWLLMGTGVALVASKIYRRSK